MKFCSGCGAEVQANSQKEVVPVISDVHDVKAKLKLPAIAMIVVAGIGLLYSFVVLIFFTGMDPRNQGDIVMQRIMPIFSILSFSAFGVSIYGAVQMMNVKKYGFAVICAIITILSPIFTLQCFFILLFTPIGIWALVILLKPEIKSAFAGNSMPVP